MELEISPRCFCLKHTVEGPATIEEIVINGGGGMGGSQVVVYGSISAPTAAKDKLRVNMGQVKITLHNSRRVIWVNPRYIGTCEEVKLWCSSTTHQNDSFENPYLVFFITSVKVETITALLKQDHAKQPKNLFECKVVDANQC